MPGFLCQNVDEMLVVLDDKVRFWFYSGISVYQRIYGIHAIHATRYTRLYTVYPLPGGAAGAGAGAGAGGSPGARDAGGRAGAAGRGADAPGRAQVREFELLWPRERTRLTKKHKLRRFCYYMKGVPVRDPLLFPPKLLASFSRRVC